MVLECSLSWEDSEKSLGDHSLKNGMVLVARLKARLVAIGYGQTYGWIT